MQVKGILLALAAWLAGMTFLNADPLADGFQNPPDSAKLRAYWWWLNGNITKAAITSDLEEMKSKGFGGALICDAGGAEQDGNDRVPAGPTFFSAEWRELYKHALREADRLGLEMSLNIQSGWNLGGPMVKPEDAPKKLVWTELNLRGPKTFAGKLDQPRGRDNFYQELFVVAYRVKPPVETKSALAGVTASSEQSANPASHAVDGKTETFWVSNSSEAGGGPTRARPQWLQFNFAAPVSVNRLTLTPRAEYGPRDCELQVSDDGKSFRTVQAFTVPQRGETQVDLPATGGRAFRVVCFSAFDPRFPQSPRNVQIAELAIGGPDGAWHGASVPKRPQIQNWREKALHTGLRPFSAPDTRPLFQELPAQPGEEDTRTADVVDLTAKLDADGVLRWEVPAGDWEILRIGCTLNDHCRVSTCSDGWQGYALDPFDAGAFRRYWDAVVEPLIADAGPLAGKALKYLHTDSWEVEVANWTPTLREEFRRRRGYELLPWLPVLAGRIVNDRDESNRFLHDFRKTIGDLAIDNHYRLFKEGAHQHGLLIHPESGGPHAVPIDAQRCLGFNDAPMSEFWAWSWRHRVGDQNRFFVKQPASAAHTYGRKLVLAEGFTTIGPHWQETLGDNLKPSFDKALCEGLNLLVWHAFVSSPAEMGMPGQQYFAGTHLNPNVTWWSKSKAFFDYLNRSQFLMQQGLFIADVAYYYGDHVPNFSQLKRSDPAGVLPGYDYDVVTEEVILTRMSVREGRIALPDGMSYRVLVLPDRASISLAVLRKLKELVQAGATVVGPKPVATHSLQNLPQADAEVKRLGDEFWGNSNDQTLGERRFGQGRIVWGKTAREVLLADGVKPDFEIESMLNPQSSTDFDYIHRREGETEIYFVANRSNRWEEATCTFRVTAKAPELWDAVTGERRFAAAYTQADGRTLVPLEFTPCGSWFVIFREPAAKHPATAKSNTRKFNPTAELDGAWTVKFDPKWGGPVSVEFAQLVSWTERTEPGIKFYSGTAVYEKQFDLPADSRTTRRSSRLWLDLGHVRELAEVRLNGRSLGVLWATPFRVDITDAVKPMGNQLEIEVVNFWPNRIIGDDALPREQRLTRTNVRKLTKDTPLMPSGLLGPVKLLTETTATR